MDREPESRRTDREIRVTVSGGDEYPVRIGRGVLDLLAPMIESLSPAHAYALIADAKVFGLHGRRVRAALDAVARPITVHTFTPGEENKNREHWSRLTDEILSAGLGRDGCVIALGGGVAGDLAGFVASTYMRGIPVVQLPTSLVAMVDASVGGKTGVDVPLGKNLVGTFHPPRFVLADTDLCATLPRVERSQGLAEAAKHGAVLDADYFAWIDSHADALLDGDPEPTSTLVGRSVELKARVVSEDEKEGGLRQILNFGHTLGHALEAQSGFQLPHGSAVALGMILEAKLGERLGITGEGVADRLIRTLRRLELPTAVPEDSDVEGLIDLVGRDKKARGGASRYVLLSELGTVDRGEGWSRELKASDVRDFLSQPS